MRAEIRGIDDHQKRILSSLQLRQHGAELPHKNGSLLTHLAGTYRILRAWQMPEDLCLAGLTHSVYSTEHYKQALFDVRERATLRHLVGADGELLTYWFCILKRSEFWSKTDSARNIQETTLIARHDDGGEIEISQNILKKLIVLDCANAIEQDSEENGEPAPWMAWLLNLNRFIRLFPGDSVLAQAPLLEESAEKLAVNQYLAAFNSDTHEQQMLCLQAALKSNPWAAEPHVFLSLLMRQHGPNHDALELAERGLTLLRAWGTTWDKRITYEGLEGLGIRASMEIPTPPHEVSPP